MWQYTYKGPSQGFGGAGKNGHLFSESWGALTNIFREWGASPEFWGAGKQRSERDFLTRFLASGGGEGALE